MKSTANQGRGTFDAANPRRRAKIKVVLIALAVLALSPLLCMAELIFIEPASITLEKPSDWKEQSKETFPGEVPVNVCFPRLVKDGSRIEYVIWKNAEALDKALDQYIERLPQLLGEERTFKEITREPFKTASGIEGILHKIEITRSTPCGPWKHTLNCYIFGNQKGQIICLGGTGDLEEIHQIVISSLSLRQ